MAGILQGILQRILQKILQKILQRILQRIPWSGGVHWQRFKQPVAETRLVNWGQSDLNNGRNPSKNPANDPAKNPAGNPVMRIGPVADGIGLSNRLLKLVKPKSGQTILKNGRNGPEWAGRDRRWHGNLRFNRIHSQNSSGSATYDCGWRVAEPDNLQRTREMAPPEAASTEVFNSKWAWFSWKTKE